MGDLPETRLRRGLHLAIGVMACAHLFTVCLPSLLVHAEVYRSMAVELVAFALVTAVTGAAGFAAWSGRPLGRARWWLFAVLAVAATLALAGLPPAYLVAAAEWSFGVVCWAGILLLLDKGFVAVALFLAGHLAVRLVLLAVTGDVAPGEVADVLTYTAEFLLIQLAIVLAATLLGRLAVSVTAAARTRERLRTAEAVADQLHRDRRERYAELDIVPLLTELAAGVLDPADDGVRARCTLAAGRMRRLFAEQDEVPDPLLHALRACVDAAERQGLTVYLGACGTRPDPPLAVRRALTEPVLAVLASARSQARITVLGSPSAVTVSVVADGDRPVVPAPPGITVTSVTHDDRHWVEATWQTRQR
jgi:hypothetical protein